MIPVDGFILNRQKRVWDKNHFRFLSQIFFIKERYSVKNERFQRNSFFPLKTVCILAKLDIINKNRKIRISQWGNFVWKKAKSRLSWKVLIYLTKKDCELFDMDQFSTLTEQEFTTFAMTHPAGKIINM